MPPSPRPLSQAIREKASDLGFSMVGFVPATPSPELDAYLSWIDKGLHGEMAYMARPDRVARRRDLGVILPGAASLIVVGLDYASFNIPQDMLANPTRGRISNYAWGGTDYHDVLLDRLKTLAGFIHFEASDHIDSKTYVDTGAILERSHAKLAGLGFTGKNTMLIHPRRGSFFFLGEIITTAELDYDPPVPMPSCGSCTRCLVACPTDAFPKPYVLDARRCISYLTIELKGQIPLELRPLMGNWVYGCDVCQEVCPWQRFAKPTTITEFDGASIDDAAPPLADLLSLSEAGFKQRFDGSPIKRIKRERLLRNACVAAGNSGHARLSLELRDLLQDDSALLRGHAAWALGRLGGSKTALETALGRESEGWVKEEVAQALGR
ncbi:MAG: tRNA epoxyqueuosine(34) reductase QueG [Chloroflexi bacterium]|nr:tRNA epoxyqueuosine(34) reductase QueG [Chloroflexota bacterium]